MAYVGAGILTVNEVRANMGLGPLNPVQTPQPAAQKKVGIDISKFNPNHDERGRFTTADNAVTGGSPDAASLLSTLQQHPANGRETQVAADDGVQSDATVNVILDTWGNLATLNKHVADHASDFGINPKDANASYDYAKMANNFLQQAQSQKLPMIEYPNGGEIGVYDPATQTFGVYNADGQTLSFYKPTSSNYFQSQIDKVTSRGGSVINPLPENSTQISSELFKPEPVEVEGEINTGAMSGGPMRANDFLTPGHRLPGSRDDPKD